MEVAEEEVPTPAKLRKLRVVDLRKRLHSFRLPQSGQNIPHTLTLSARVCVFEQQISSFLMFT